jgi:hypothetical protein
MTTYAVGAGRRAWETLPRARAWLEAVRPAKLLVPAIAIQWLTTLALALTVRHNGWLFYQGGDQLWYYVSSWVLVHGQIPTAFIGHGWPALLAPISALAGPTLVPALPAIVLLDVLVLGPIALLCMYGIGKRIGGQIFAYWTVALWLTVPFIGIKFTDYLYHQRYTELTLPQGFGLTAMADFPSMVAVLVAVYFGLRVIERPDVVEAIAAGLATGVAVTIKPASAPFLGGLALGFLYRRRLAGAAFLAAGVAPALLTLALWKYRGLGYLPLFNSAGAERVALGLHQQLVAYNPLHHYIKFDWHRLNLNLLAIKEHFWSLRIVEWLVIAGLVGLARRSLTAFLVVGGWFAAFVVTKATYPQASVDDASVFRVMMPSYPAFILLLASLVYLFPGRHRARFEVPQPAAPRQPRPPARRRRLALLGAGAAVFALYPLALVAAASPMHGPQPRAYQAFGLLRSIDPALRLTATVSGRRVDLHWNVRKANGTQFFYRIWRSNASDGGATCTPVANASDNCQLTMDDLGAHGNGHFFDKPGRGSYTYRLGFAANWLDSPLYGDIFSLGPPLVVRVH